MDSSGTKSVWARDKIDQALREDVEAGTVSYNDFERTKKFASDAARYQYYASFAGVGAVLGTVLYRHWYRRQPFNLRSILFLPLIYTMGSAPFWLAQASAFKRYQYNLENPEGTMRALMKSRGIVVLTAGEDPSHGQPRRRMDSVDGMDNGSQSTADDTGGTRWDELRRARDMARPSSWDRIRQSHEKQGVGRTQPERAEAAPSSSEAQDYSASGKEREIDQAKFDALLEAERKMSES